MKPIKLRAPQYVEKLVESYRRMQALGVKPAAYIVDVYHDDWCALLASGGACDCNPDVGEYHRVTSPEVA